MRKRFVCSGAPLVRFFVCAYGQPLCLLGSFLRARFVCSLGVFVCAFFVCAYGQPLCLRSRSVLSCALAFAIVRAVVPSNDRMARVPFLNLCAARSFMQNGKSLLSYVVNKLRPPARLARAGAPFGQSYLAKTRLRKKRFSYRAAVKNEISILQKGLRFSRFNGITHREKTLQFSRRSVALSMRNYVSRASDGLCKTALTFITCVRRERLCSSRAVPLRSLRRLAFALFTRRPFPPRNTIPLLLRKKGRGMLFYSTLIHVSRSPRGIRRKETRLLP